MTELFDFLKEHGPTFIATSADNEATIRPFGFVDLVDGKIVFATSAYGRCAKQLRANPRFEASAVDMKTYSWVRIAAAAQEITPAQLAGHRVWMPGNVPGAEWSAYYDALAAEFGFTVDTAGPNFGVEDLLDTIAESSTVATLP